ncbi:hypothetical protein HHL16_13565 [Pseudoflavitalea sp. G-6-1-2]|uniref:hypothetical protein n=1 Tax=Pseudoflavitalea sp. G-6-1-2 TaxID=2728841 RepID=UPI00146EE96E|nr:hypothetical protein [Pseudoflavitalea sp. G-6-1-2]NML21912.1 hypothetical protein [Pseudoflavitalea sp. G-6-1-2]
MAQSKSRADILLTNASGDSLLLPASYYQAVLKHYPELIHHAKPQAPDQLYFSRSSALLFFDSEAGKDLYYDVYAYFLKQSQPGKAAIRKKLDSLFRHIHTLYAQLKCSGGQYYVHRENRIPAYVEYAVHKYSRSPEQSIDNAAKQRLIASLRQLVNDELEIDDDVVGCEAERKQTLPALIVSIDSLITENFYLQEALSFLEATKKGD